MSDLYKLGKQSIPYDGKTKGNKFMFELDITSTLVDNFSVQLFNVLKSVVFDGTTQNGTTYYPFTLDGYELVIATGNSVSIQTNGNLIFKKAGGTLLTASTPSSQNLTYRDFYSMIASGQYFKLTKIILNCSNANQLRSGTLNVINISDEGILKRQSVPLTTFYSPNQEQNNTLIVDINTEICKNQGIELLIFPTTTVNVQFFIES